MRLILWTIVAVLVAIWLAGSAFFTVDRKDFVYVTQFGRHVATYDGATDGGLHVKWPWPIQSVQRLDNRLQFFDVREVELPTHDPRGKTIDKMLMVSAYVCWRIAGKGSGSEEGVDRFIRTVATPENGRKILEQRVISRLGAEIGKMPLDDLINAAPDGQIEQRMDQLRNRLLGDNSAGKPARGAEDSLKRMAREEYGIDLVDIRLRRFNHPVSVRDEIFNRIKSERAKKVADYRSEGDKLAADIISAARKEERDILTEARSQEKRLKEEAAVKADAIRNQAQSRDPEFYAFLQKLETYQRILSDSKDVLLLSSKNELFDMLLKPPRYSNSQGTRAPAAERSPPSAPRESREPVPAPNATDPRTQKPEPATKKEAQP